MNEEKIRKKENCAKVKNSMNEIRKTLDNLSFTSFHLRILTGLGISWVIDGYEVSLLSVLSGVLKEQLNMSDLGIAQAGSFYLLGCVFGAIIFAILSNKYGRKNLFSTTLLIYIVSITLTSFSNSQSGFYLCRFFTGISIGGEYTAIFAAIDELIPIKYRGVTNIIIDGTWHLGSILACIFSYSLLNLYSKPFNAMRPPNINNESASNKGLNKNNMNGQLSITSVAFRNIHEVDTNSEYIWRFLFLVGALVAIPIIFLRSNIPESPRWLFLKGKNKEAVDQLNFIKHQIKIEKVEDITRDHDEERDKLNNPDDDVNYSTHLEISDQNKNEILNDNSDKVQKSKFDIIFRTFFIRYPSRFFYALSLMVSQAFFYNGLYYTFGLVLENYYNIPKESFGLYLVPMSIANFLGPLFLAKYFDSWSRRKMIAICYFLSGVILILSGWLLMHNYLTLPSQISIWSILFFIASPGSSAAHLTVSEIFPTEIRSEALACFFSIGLLIGGVISPFIFGSLIGKERVTFALAYLISSILMIGSSAISLIYGVDCENKSLEEICNTSE